MKVVICGMSGMVGSELKAYFESEHNEVVGLKVRDNTPVDEIAKRLHKADLLINLAGANILARWSESYKVRLVQSRINTTRKLVDAMQSMSEPPLLFLNASAVGVYANNSAHGDDSTDYENDFLSRLVQEWEAEAQKVSVLHVRTVCMRFGVIYAKSGGAMSKMLPPFKMGVGGKMGSGKQMVSWIHIQDLIGAIAFLIKTPSIEGSVNFSAPYPLDNLAQTNIMGKKLNRPTFFSVPAFMVKLLFGEGSTVMLDSKEVYPTKLLDAGFTFEYPDFESAFSDIIR